LLAVAFACASAADAQMVVDPGTVIRTVQTSSWSPPSPDPSGIAYRPDTGQLITCDAEVEEVVQGFTHYQGVNVWTHTRTGVVQSTYTTVGYSNEPTGVAFDPAGGRLWFADDVRGSIHQVLFGSDGIFGTADDVITDLDDVNSTGCDDLEDLTYDNLNNRIFIASGGGQEICRLDRGPNGVFDGLPPTGDDVVTTFSVAQWGITDPEGIVYDPFWNTLVVADRGTRDLYELTPSAGLLRRIDVNFPGGTKPAGVAIAPGTTNPMLRNYYVVDRRVDNDTDPFENDGRLFEVVAVPLGGNGAPVVDAGPSQTIFWPTNSLTLQGFVSDDGHPFPPSALTVLWSKQSGPGTVGFANPNEVNTIASFSLPGPYVLQLVANDSSLSTLDTVGITVANDVSLALAITGPGTVTLSPPGGSYAFGQTVTLTATPYAGARFNGWSGDLSGSATPQNLVMNGDKSVTASFTGNGTGCGIGPELAALLPLLGLLLRRQRTGRERAR
jgi:DNA-binding beta-propeller fold protein YncE